MGGHALKTVETRRYAKDEYEAIKKEVCSRLAAQQLQQQQRSGVEEEEDGGRVNSCADPRVESSPAPARKRSASSDDAPAVVGFCIVKELPGKDSFGDLDVLVHLEGDVGLSPAAVRSFITATFAPQEIQRNGTVYSFDFREFQIDFILQASSAHLAMSDFYLAYSDVGGLLGRMASAHNLKYGDGGLWCNVTESTLDETKRVDQTKRRGKVILSTCPRAICEYFAMDYDRFMAGFESQDDVIAWIKTCRFFHAEDFRRLNHRHRHRADTRPFYVRFLESIDIGASEVQPAINDSQGEVRQCAQREALAHFGKEGEIQAIADRLQRKKDAKEKFSGLVFQEMGVPKKRIGKAITKMQTDYAHVQNQEEFEEWILATPREELLDAAREIVAQL